MHRIPPVFAWFVFSAGGTQIEEPAVSMLEWASRASTWSKDCNTIKAKWCRPVLMDSAKNDRLFLSGCHLPPKNGSYFVRCTLQPFERFYPGEELSFVTGTFSRSVEKKFKLMVALFRASDIYENVEKATPLSVQIDAPIVDRGPHLLMAGLSETVTDAVAPDSEGEYIWKLVIVESDSFDQIVLRDELAIPFIVSADGQRPLGKPKAKHCTGLKCTDPSEQFFIESITSFNPFLSNTSLHCLLPRFPDRDIHRRLNRIHSRTVGSGRPKARVIFTLTPGRTGTTYLASLVASSGQAVVTHDSRHCKALHAIIRWRNVIKTHEVLLALESALQYQEVTPTYVEFTGRFIIDSLPLVEVLNEFFDVTVISLTRHFPSIVTSWSNHLRELSYRGSFASVPGERELWRTGAHFKSLTNTSTIELADRDSMSRFITGSLLMFEMVRKMVLDNLPKSVRLINIRAERTFGNQCAVPFLALLNLSTTKLTALVVEKRRFRHVDYSRIVGGAEDGSCLQLAEFCDEPWVQDKCSVTCKGFREGFGYDDYNRSISRLWPEISPELQEIVQHLSTRVKCEVARHELDHL